MRVLLVTNIPTPYRLPLFREISQQLGREGLEFRVVFAAEGYARRKWDMALDGCGFDFLTLRSRPMVLNGDSEQTTFSYRGLTKAIRDYQPAVVIAPGFSVGTTKIWLRSKIGGPRYLIWTGSVAGRPQAASRLQRRLLAAGAAGAIAYGSKAAAYLMSLGIPAQQIFTAINTVDTAFFTAETDGLRQGQAPDPRKVLTCVSYLSVRKNIVRLLDVVRHLAQRRSDFVLDVIGDGDDRPRLQEYVESHRLGEFVRFHGYRQQRELPAFYAPSTCFLYQTDFDIWGLVLVEAMAAGLPCVASTNAGATADLIRDEVTGFAVDFNDTARVGETVERLLADPALARQIGQTASRFINDHATIAMSATGFVRAVASVLHAA